MGYFANMGAGFNMTTGPIDITSLPPFKIPMPSLNMGFYITGAPPCITVVLEFLPGCNILYIILVTPIDDEDGPMGGEVSQTIVEIQKPLTGDPTVLFDGAPACVEGVTMGPGNLINTIVDNEMNVQFAVCAA